MAKKKKAEVKVAAETRDSARNLLPNVITCLQETINKNAGSVAAIQAAKLLVELAQLENAPTQSKIEVSFGELKLDEDTKPTEEVKPIGTEAPPNVQGTEGICASEGTIP